MFIVDNKCLFLEINYRKLKKPASEPVDPAKLFEQLPL